VFALSVGAAGALAGAAGLGAVGGFAAGGASIVQQLLNGSNGADSSATDMSCKMSGKGQRNPLPTKSKPNSSECWDRGGGKGTIRDYDSDGKAQTDYDFGHDHGAGDPHAHDWDWSSGTPVRGPGRPL